MSVPLSNVPSTLYGQLDVTFNNAAISVPPAPVDQVPERDLDHVCTVSLKGTWLAVSAEVAAVRATADTGAIVNNSSVGSLMGNPALPAYAATKRAVNSLTESAAIAYGPEGIRVNAVAPGTTLTGTVRAWNDHSPGVIVQLNARTPLRRAADPDEIAQAAWLLGDRASYVT